MANILEQAYRNRFLDREYIDYNYITRITRIPSRQLKNMQVFEGLPYRYDPQGHKEFRMTDAMSALAKARLTPPDNLHPLYEFSVAEAMNELMIKPKAVMKLIKEGLLRSHVSERDGYRKVYRKDIEYYRRNWDPVYLAEQMKVPLRRSLCALIMGIKMSTMSKLEMAKVLVPEPRKKGERVKFSKTTVLKHLKGRKVRVYRKEPLPELMIPELALVYSGFSPAKFEQLGKTNQIHAIWHTYPDGKKKWVYSKDELDKVRDEHLAREYYCEGLPYYTRKAIKYKFFKTDRWIDTFIAGKCRRMKNKTTMLPAENDGVRSSGWFRGDVHEVVYSGADFAYRKPRKKMKATRRKYMQVTAEAKTDIVFSSPVEQMEAAIRAAMEQKEEDRRKKLQEAYAKKQAIAAKRNAIRNILSTGVLNVPRQMSRNDLLRFADDRQVVTFLISTDRKVGRYVNFPHTKDERIFRAVTGAKIGRRVIPHIFARGILNALHTFNSYKFESLPSWVVLVSSTSMISDPLFHDKLKALPLEIGAIGPYGYGYVLPDGSWDRCSETYGQYGVYSEITGSSRKVLGLSAVDGEHRVVMLDGPFIAVRGEYMQELSAMRYFMPLGDARGFLVPAVSAIMRRMGIPMMQIPVECWGSEEYEVHSGTPEMNLAVDKVNSFVSMTESELNMFLQKKRN